jgi:hypothetical protein
MAQYDFQIVEQAGGRVSHLNDRVTQLVSEGWEPQMMCGTSPHISLLLRRPAVAPAASAPAPAQAAAPQPPVQAPVQPRPQA